MGDYKVPNAEISQQKYLHVYSRGPGQCVQVTVHEL